MASLVSGNVAVRYNEGSEVIVTRDVILAASSRLKGTVNPSTTTTTTTTRTITTSSMDTSGDSNIDTANGTAAATVGAITSVVGSAASLTVKAERPDHLAGTSTSPSSTVAAVAAGPISTGSSLFASIANSNKTTRPDDWLATNSPESPQSSLQSQHVVYTASQQQLPEQPPVAHSSPHQQQQVSNNGYASPMSTGSYDPYSPNGKIGEYSLFR